jgi:hypothetical protein
LLDDYRSLRTRILRGVSGIRLCWCLLMEMGISYALLTLPLPFYDVFPIIIIIHHRLTRTPPTHTVQRPSPPPRRRGGRRDSCTAPLKLHQGIPPETRCGGRSMSGDGSYVCQSAGLSKAIAKMGFVGFQARSFAPLLAGFTRSQDLFDFADAGDKKEAAGFKIRGSWLLILHEMCWN